MFSSPKYEGSLKIKPRNESGKNLSFYRTLKRMEKGLMTCLIEKMSMVELQKISWPLLRKMLIHWASLFEKEVHG